MKKINEIIILIIFSIIISSCSAIPKPNPDKTDSILIVPVSVTNKSKFPISKQVNFTFRKVDDGSKHYHTYSPKVDNSYVILKHLKPGNYKFLRVSESKNSKYGKTLTDSLSFVEMSSRTFWLRTGGIKRVLQDTGVLEWEISKLKGEDGKTNKDSTQITHKQTR